MAAPPSRSPLPLAAGQGGRDIVVQLERLKLKVPPWRTLPWNGTPCPVVLELTDDMQRTVRGVQSVVYIKAEAECLATGERFPCALAPQDPSKTKGAVIAAGEGSCSLVLVVGSSGGEEGSQGEGSCAPPAEVYVTFTASSEYCPAGRVHLGMHHTVLSATAGPCAIAPTEEGAAADKAEVCRVLPVPGALPLLLQEDPRAHGHGTPDTWGTVWDSGVVLASYLALALGPAAGAAAGGGRCAGAAAGAVATGGGGTGAGSAAGALRGEAAGTLAAKLAAARIGGEAGGGGEGGGARPRAVEVGCGGGVAGLALARLGYDVILTDGEEKALALATDNAAANGLSARTEASVLWWGDEAAARALHPPLDVVVAADVAYSEALFAPLVNTLVWLSGPDTVLLLAFRRRSGGVKKFFDLLEQSFKVEPVERGEYHPTMRAADITIFRLHLAPRPPAYSLEVSDGQVEVILQVPLLQSAAGVNLALIGGGPETSRASLEVAWAEGGWYAPVRVPLPVAVADGGTRVKFSKKKRVLTAVLPRCLPEE